MADPHRRLAAAALAALLALGAAACGDDGDASDRAADDAEPNFTAAEVPEEAVPYVDALVVELTSEPTMPIPDDQARCIAGRMVQVLQLERLQAAGVEPDQLSEGNLEFDDLGLVEDDGLKLVDAFQQCDFDLFETVIDLMAAGTPDEAEARRCLQASLSRDDLRQSMARSFVAGAEDVDDLELDPMSRAMFTCVMGEELVEDFEQVEGEL
jgi:hypothetical protein